MSALLLMLARLGGGGGDGGVDVRSGGLTQTEREHGYSH